MPWRWTAAALLLWAVAGPAVAKKKIDVYVAGFFPVGGGVRQSLGRGVMPALNLAVEDVNKHPTVLRNYKLHVIWNDTQCNTAIGTKAFFDNMHKAPKKLMLFGAACNHVTDPIAQTSKHWHITQLTYADTHPMFGAEKYPNFFRMVPSETEFNYPRVHLLRRFNWTRVGTLFQNEPRHALAHNHLLSLLESDGFDIVETQSFADELKGQLEKLLEKDVRIILGFFSERWARRIFCQAKRHHMYGKNFQWIITGMYREKWWSQIGGGAGDEFEVDIKEEPHESGGEGCAIEEIMTALEGCIMIDLLPLASNKSRIVFNKTIAQYEEEYRSRSAGLYSRFHGYTYDGVWTMALAIQSVGHKLHKINRINNTMITIQDFKYREKIWEQRFTEAMTGVHFEGVTGPVQFNKDNARKGYILLKQFQGGREVKIAEYDGFDDVLHLGRGHPVYWPGGVPPIDRTLKLIEKTRVNIRIYVVLVTIASLGIVMATVFLCINIHFRNQRYIKMSSPHLNNLIIVGCILTYTSVILLGLDSGLTSEESFPYICTARAWVLMSGFTLAFGSMFSKTWRVHSIFTDVQLNKKVIKDYQLFLVVFVLLCVDVAIMTTWQIIDPFYRETKLFPGYVRGEILVIPENEYCKSQKISIFIGCIYAYKGLLMIFGGFLAWETRHVSIPALNDSKYIGMSVYNVVIMCIIGAPISYILSDEQDAAYILISVFIIFCTTGTLCLVFGPKIVELRRNPQGIIDKRMVRPTLRTQKRHDSDSDASDFQDQIKKAETDRQIFSKKLTEREQEMKGLLEQLDEDSLEIMEDEAGPGPRRLSKPRSVERLRIEGPSVTETTTEITELTSLCSTTSHDGGGEYVGTRLSCVSSPATNTISTTTIHQQNLPYSPHQHQHESCGGLAPSTTSTTTQPVKPIGYEGPSKSVSFQMEDERLSTMQVASQYYVTKPVTSQAPSYVQPANVLVHPVLSPPAFIQNEHVQGYGGVYTHPISSIIPEPSQYQIRRDSRTSGILQNRRELPMYPMPQEVIPPQGFGASPPRAMLNNDPLTCVVSSEVHARGTRANTPPAEDLPTRRNMPLMVPNTNRRSSEPMRPQPGLYLGYYQDDSIPRAAEAEAYRTAARRGSALKRDEGSTRSISRSHLRRDSFGEVSSSRRSPSQDSLDIGREPNSPKEDFGSQESIDRKDGGASQESFGTTSSRGSVYSMTSEGTAPNRGAGRHPGVPAASVRTSDRAATNYMNGDLSESSDDLARPSAPREQSRELSGLHRTSSEPYYAFDDMAGHRSIEEALRILQQSGGDRSTMQDADPRRTTLVRRERMPFESAAFVGYTQSLRGRSHSVTRSRATTTSVAAAIAAARSKNASDNALDHDTSILPIFQKLLCERQRSYSGGSREFTMSSCPNITIKCDIVEYL